MLDRMRHESWYRHCAHVEPDLGLAMGRMSLGYAPQPPKPAVSEDGTMIALMEGEIYNADRLRATLGLVSQGAPCQDPTELLLRGFQTQGLSFLRQVSGSFSAVIWDRNARRIHVITDRFATRPLYFATSDCRFVFGSQIATLIVDPTVSRAVSPRGLAQFFTFGHNLGNDTLLEAVRVVPAATCLTYDIQRGDVSAETYWSTTDVKERPAASQLETLSEITEAFQRAVESRVASTPNLGLALSGGLDARTILGVIDAQAVDLKTVCLGMQGCRDHKSAQQLADFFGCEHHNHTLDTAFLADYASHLERMVRLTDGQYLSQCIVMPTFPLYRKLGIRVLLRGHAGELMHMRKAYSFSLDREGLQIATDLQLADWLLRHLQAYLMDGVEVPLFRAPYADSLGELAKQSLADSLSPLQAIDPPLQRVWHLFVNERLRRETMLSMVKFNSIVEPRLPYLDNDLVEILLASPPELKLGEEIQTHILRRRRPEFLNVVNTNTGTRMGAGQGRLAYAAVYSKVMAKLGMPGYQPYERLGLWLRRELSGLVHEILLSDQCLDRGVFDPAGVRRVVDNHHTNRRNHTFLLLAMMVFESGQRLIHGEELRDGSVLLANSLGA